jgi:signal transduction histidine kinase
MKNHVAGSGEIQTLALCAIEERYRSLLGSMDVGFCVVEMQFDDADNPLDFRFLETNPAFEKQSGLSDAVGKCVRTLVPDLEAHWFETYGRVALTGESIRFVHQARALDARWFDVYAIRLGAPELRHVAVLFTDISVRRRLEEQAKEQANSLAELNRRKNEFIATLSHELRNPLAAIRHAAELIQMHRNPDPLQLEALSLPDKAVPVLGDDARLQQVVVSILDNANRYTDRSGLITVELRTESDEAVLLVRDNGRGIEPEILPHIFELFTQADPSRTQIKADWASDSRSYNRWLPCTEGKWRRTRHRDKGASSS